ncbi:MAG: hypothetical protein IBX55_20940 [Methyloprofundus sp.]|nr:hypothetical protein [Methyloprofundus sp.]
MHFLTDYIDVKLLHRIMLAGAVVFLTVGYYSLSYGGEGFYQFGLSMVGAGLVGAVIGFLTDQAACGGK